MHPIIREFIETNNKLSDIIEKYHHKDQYLETVFLKICQSLGYESIDNELLLELDKAIVNGHPDQNLYLLFISFCIIAVSYRFQTEKAKVLLSIGESISQEEIHPVLKSYFTLAKGTLKIHDHKADEGINLIKEAITIIDKRSPRYNTIFFGMASMIALEGKLNELKPEELSILDTQVNDNLALVSINLKVTNFAFIGKSKEGFALMEVYQKFLNGVETVLFKNLKDLLKIFSGNYEEKNYDRIFFKNIAKAYSLILSDNFKEALQITTLLTQEVFDFIHIFRINLPLHIQLCLKNIGMVRLMLQEMRQNRNTHYLDDFFIARLQLLEQNREAAKETFSRLIENVKKYDAMNRLIFEMQFAKEMKGSDILWLMSNINEKNTTKLIDGKKENSLNPKKIEKGIQLLIGNGPLITQVKELVKKFAKLKDPVLITGETGTGKELVSRAIHDEGGHSKEPFLAINCGALTESLLQSELFGYVAGAFTGAQRERKGIFEAAGIGTVFLDEFGDISPKLQVSLLRVLESNEIRLIGDTNTRLIKCKIIIATNINLHQAVEMKQFREDLYFRLARFDIKLPPLRERTGDIVKLIDYFLVESNDSNSRKKLSKELLEALTSYRWPGNIRELKNEIERLKILHIDKEILNLEDFDFSRLQGEVLNKPKSANEIIAKQRTSPPSFAPERMEDDQVLKIVQSGFKADQRQEYLKGLFRQYKKLTRLQIIKIMSISPVTATKDLDILCKLSFIEKRTPTKSVNSYYFVLVEHGPEMT